MKTLRTCSCGQPGIKELSKGTWVCDACAELGQSRRSQKKCSGVKNRNPCTSAKQWEVIDTPICGGSLEHLERMLGKI